jgi:hypothetical protein
MMRVLVFRFFLKLNSLILNLFNISLFTKTPDKELVNELRASYKELPTYGDLSSTNLSEEHALEVWQQNLNVLRESVLNNQIDLFLSWPVILKTMNLGINADFIYDEIKYLKKHKNWKIYKKGIREDWFGNRSMYAFYPSSSAILIHHGHHIAQFESITNTNIVDQDCILEFGGGFGSMCRLNYNLGFDGGYIIFDFSHFSLLQKYYLKNINIPVVSVNEFMKTKKGVVCISDLEQLKAILDIFDNKTKILLIATWSLSEAPISVRDLFIDCCDNVSSFLIAYQDNFASIDNKKYFNSFQKKRDKLFWADNKIEHLPSDNYLFGSKNIKV